MQGRRTKRSDLPGRSPNTPVEERIYICNLPCGHNQPMTILVADPDSFSADGLEKRFEDAVVAVELGTFKANCQVCNAACSVDPVYLIHPIREETLPRDWWKFDKPAGYLRP